jgi:phosphatidylglycerol:prolipoprotein diacylglycerol transferase
VLDHWPAFLAHPLDALAIWEGGIAVYGAFLGGLLAGALAARRAGLPVWGLLDVAAPAMLVGQAVGRLGCLANGDAWGAPCAGPLCFVYTHPHALLPPSLLGVPTHPYPLYEIGATLVLLAALWWARRWLARPGAAFLAAALGYAVTRFSLSFFRQEALVLWGLQQAQVLALATALTVGVLLLVRWYVARQVAPLAEPGTGMHA